MLIYRHLYFYVYLISTVFLLANNRISAQSAPSITGFSPTEYCYDSPSPITITGADFDTVTEVRVGSTVINSSFYTVSNTQIIINSLPTGLTDGVIRVTNPSGSDTTASVLSINDLPGTPSTISGDVDLCKEGGFYTFSVNSVAGADTYVWEFTPDISSSLTISGTSNNSVLTFSIPSGVSPGSFNVVVYAENSCGQGPDSPVKTIRIHAGVADAGLITEGSSKSAVCRDGTEEIELSVPAISGATTYQWDGYTGFTPVGATNQRTIRLRIDSNATTGSRNITVKGVNDNCEGASSTFVIDVNSLPSLVDGTTQTICAGDAITIGQATSLTPVWTSTPVDPAIVAGDEFQNLNPTQTTSYTLTVTNADGCSVSTTYSVIVNQLPLVDAGGDQTICDGNSVTLGTAAQAGRSYTWTSGGNQIGTGATISVSPNTTTDYTLTVRDTASGCEDDETITVTVNTAPVINAGADISACGDGDPVSLNPSYTDILSSTISWQAIGGGGSFAADFSTFTPSAAQLANGQVTLEISGQGAAPCNQTQSDQLIITFGTLASGSIDSLSSICEGDTLNLQANTNNNTANEVAWEFPANPGGNIARQSATNLQTYAPSAAEITAGSFIVRMIIYPPAPCDDTITVTKTINITSAPVINSINPPNGSSYCDDGSTIGLSCTFTGNSVQWINENGGGTISNPNNPTTAFYTPDASDFQRGNVRLKLVVNGASPCSSPASQTITLNLYEELTVTAGPEFTFCENETPVLPALTISDVNDVFSYQWSVVSGPVAITPGTENTLRPTLEPSGSGSATLQLVTTPNAPCSTVITTLQQLNIVYAPSADAGADQDICVDAGSPVVVNVVGNNSDSYAYDSYQWTTDGTGSFANAAVKSTAYTPSQADINSGSVQLTFRVTQNDCTDVTDSMIVNFYSDLDINAGVDRTMCENTSVLINDAVINYPTGNVLTAYPVTYQWTVVSGAAIGTLSNDTSLNATFNANPSQQGTVILRLTATPDAAFPCTSVITDELTITVNPAPTVQASSGSPTINFCQPSGSAIFTVDLADINPTATNYGILTWTTNGSGSFSNPNTLTPIYTPSANDITTGSVQLTLTNGGLTSCSPVSDSYTINLIAQPTVNILNSSNADTDVITLCEDELTYTFSNVNVTDVDTYAWTGGAGFSDPSILNPIYTFTPADKAAGTIQLTLTGTNGTCGSTANDVVTINFEREPTVSTGETTTVTLCGSVSQYSLSSGTASNTANTVWMVTGGTGTINNPNSLTNAEYIPSAADQLGLNNPILITLQGNPISECPDADTDSFNLVFDPVPVITVPTNQSICETDTYQVLGLTIANSYDASSIVFTSTGRGSFTNTLNPLEPIYTLDTADRTAGQITITITIAANSSCNQNISASFVLSIEETPKITLADDDFTLCEGDVVDFTNLVTAGGNYSSIVWTTPNGAGSFSDPNIEEPIYTPAASDVALSPLLLEITVNPLSDCLSSVTRQITVNYNEAPEISTFTAADICENSSLVLTQGTNFVIDHFDSFYFSTSDNTGTIQNNGSAIVTIVPSTAHINQGFVDVVLNLETDPATTCAAISNTLRVNIQQLSEIIGLPPSQSICEGETYTSNTVVVTDADTISWSAATVNNTGFSSTNQAVVTYTPLSQDINRGYVDLTITTTNVSPTCSGDKSETIRLNIESSVVVDLNNTITRTICVSGTYTVDAADITTLDNETTFLWTTLNGAGNILGANSLTPIYEPVAADLNLPGARVRLVLTASNTLCSEVSDEIFIDIIPQASVSINDPDNDGIAFICENGTLTLNASANDYDTSSISWSVISGPGNFTSGANTLNPVFTADTGNTADVRVRVSVTGNNPCVDTFSDEIIIRTERINTVSLGTSSVTICKTESTYNITGSGAVDDTNIMWTSSGSPGTFSSPTDLNPIYTPSAADHAAGIVTLTLEGRSDNPPCSSSVFPSTSLTIRFEDAPSASLVDPSIDLCVGSSYTVNDLTANDYTSISWIRVGGSGSLTNANTTLPSYQSAASDSGQVLLVGTLTGLNVCSSITITKTINIIPRLSSIDLGNNQTICSNDTEVVLSATFTPGNNFQTLTWASDGDGIFDTSASSTTLVRYIPGPVDLQGTNNPIEITLTATPETACSGVISNVIGTMYVNVDLPPVINSVTAVKDPICQDEDVTLNAVLSGPAPNNVYWTATQANVEVTTGFIGRTTLNPSYTPTALDISLGTVTLTLHVVSEAPCDEITQSIQVDVSGLPTADAGADIAPCQGETITVADAAVTNGTIQWTVSGINGASVVSGTVLSNATTINPTLAIDASQTGQLELTLTVTPQDGCSGGSNVIDTKIVDVQSIPVISGPTTGTHCELELNDRIQITGFTVQNTTNYSWSILSGGGTLNQNTILSPIYTPAASDYTNGFVRFEIQATGGGSCSTNPVQQITIDLYSIPTITTSTSLAECQDSSAPTGIAIESTIEGETLIRWTTNGTGNFAGLAFSNLEDPIYTPSAADITNGSVTLDVEITGQTVCGASHVINESVTINFTTPVVVQLTAPSEICEGSLINISAVTQPTDATILWDTDDGNPSNFNSTTNKVNTYEPTAADIARGYVTLKLRSDTYAACPDGSWVTKVVTITAAPEATINDASPILVCEGTSTLNINATLSDALNYSWNFNGAGGSYVAVDPADTTNPDIIYTPALSDIGNTYVFELTANAIAPCSTPVTTSVTVTFVRSPDVDAGNALSICQNGGYLTGTSISNAASWTWIGNGSLTPALDQSDPSTVQYIPTAAEISAGIATLTLRGFPLNGCGAFVDDTKTLNIDRSPSVNLNTTISLCEDDGSYTFTNADYTNLPQDYDSITWTHNGNGSFTNNGTIYPTYNPGAGDGTVILTITLDPSGNCTSAVSDTITLTYITNPTINAGSDFNICTTAGSNVPLNQASSSGSGLSYQWTSPSGGTFTNANALTTNYQPSAADITNGSVILTLTATSAAPCNKSVFSTLTISFNENPTVSIINNAQACMGSSITLTASGTYDNITWSTNGIGTLVNNVYTPAASESGLTIEFVALASNNNSCSSVNDSINITLIPEVTVDAGDSSVSVCQGETQVNLQGIVTGSPDSVLWTLPAGSDSTLTSNNTSNTILNIGPTDRAVGSLSLSLSAIRAGACPVNISDQINLIFTDELTVDAGPNQTSCGQLPVDLDDAVVSSSQNVTYQWSTSGSGSFDVSTALSTVYRPSLADISGSVSLTLTVTKLDSGCTNVASDTLVVTFTEGTTVDAGGNLSVCEGSDVLPNASVINADSFYWTTGGSGSYNGTENNEDPTYTPSAADIASGSVSLSLIVTTAGGCDGTIQETILVTLFQRPAFTIDQDTDADGEIFVCSSEDSINLSASLNVSQTSISNISWSGGTGGTYQSGQGTLNVNYRFSTVEKTNGTTTLRLDADGENGCADPTQAVLIVTFVDPITVTPVKNLDPGVGCKGQTITLSVNPIAAASTYNWTVPTGMTITSGAGTNQISVEIDSLSTTGSKTIRVSAENDCGVSALTNFEVNVTEDELSNISGAIDVCLGDSAIQYSVNSIPGAIYTWSYSGSGTTIVGPTNSSQITVNYASNASSGSWTVTASLSCGFITPIETLAVTVNELPLLNTALISAAYCSGPLGINLGYTNKLNSEIVSVTWQRDLVAGVLPATGSGQGDVLNESLNNTNSVNTTVEYEITSTDNNGCENTETISFILYPQLSIINNTKDICTGDNVDLTFTNTNGYSGISYSWSRVLPNGILSTSNAGYSGATISETLINSTQNPIDVGYNVTQQISGCTQTQVVTITVNPKPSLTINRQRSLNSGQQLNIDLTSASDINASVSYAYTPNANITVTPGVLDASDNIDQQLTNTSTSTQILNYQITMNSNGGCSNTESITVEVFPCPQITSSLALVEICSGDDFIYTIASNMGDGITYSWSRAVTAGITNAASSGNTKYINETLFNSSNIPYEATYTINAQSNIGTCLSTETVRVLVKPNPQVNSTLAVGVCDGESLDYDISSNVDGSTFTWSQLTNTNVNGGAVVNGATDNISVLLDNTSNINQTVSFEITPAYNGCTGEVYTLEVTVYPEPELIEANTMSNPLTVCSSESFNQALTVNNDSSPSITWTRDAVSGISNAPGSGNTTINEILVNTSNTTITVVYNIGLTTSDGCSLSSSSTLYVNVLPVPSLTADALNPDPICSGEDVNHGLASNLSGVTFTWERELPAGISSDANPGVYQETSNTINEVLTNSTNADVPVRYTVSMQGLDGCNDVTQFFEVTVYPSPNIISPLAVGMCSGQETDYDITSRVGSTYSWRRLSNPNINGGAISTGTSNRINETLTNTSSVTQLVYYEIDATSSLRGCTSSTATVVFTVNPSPQLISSATEDICSEEVFSYTIQSDFNSGVSYSWSRPTVTGIQETARNGGSNTIFESLTNQTDASIIVPYTLVLEYQGCTTTSTLNVTVFPTPTLSSTLFPGVCHGEVFSYTPTSDTPGTTFEWEINPSDLPAGVTHTGSVTGTGDITATFEHNYDTAVLLEIPITSTANGCSGNSQTLNLRVLPELKLTNSVTLTICSDQSVNYSPEYFDYWNTSNPLFRWSRNAVAGISNPAAADNGAITEILVNTSTVSQTVTYQYTIDALNTENCTSSGSFSVIVYPRPVLTGGSDTHSGICSGEDVNHTLQSNLTGTVFTWTRTLPNGVTSDLYATSHTEVANVINEVLTNVNNSTTSVTYQVSLSGNDGCANQTFTVVVPVNPSASITSVDALSICSGESTSYTITSNINANYSWRRLSNPNINGGVVTTGTSNLIDEVLTNSTTQTQLVYYEIDSTSALEGCVAATTTLVVTVNPTPQIISSLSEDVCSGGTFTYTINSDFTSGVSYNWSRPTVIGIDGTGRNGSGKVITEQLVNNTTDPVQVNYTLTASYQSCVSTTTLILTVYPSPELNTNLISEVCNGADFTYTPSSDTAGAQFDWTIDTTSFPAGITHTGNVTGTGIITATFEHDYNTRVDLPILVTTSANSCDGITQTVLARVEPKLYLTNVSTITICSGNSPNYIPAYIDYYSTGTTFSWSRALVPGISNPSSSGSGPITENLENTSTTSRTVVYQYTIQSSVAAGCSESGSFSVVVYPRPILTGGSDTHGGICSGEDVNHTLQSNLAGTVFTWTRTLPNGVTSTANPNSYTEVSSIINEVLTNVNNGTASVTYQVNLTGNDGCTNQTYTVIVPVHPSASITSVDALSICSGESTNYSISSNISANYSWRRLSNPNINGGATSNDTTNLIDEVLTNTSTQTQLVYYEIDSTSALENCVAGTTTVVVTVYPTPQITSSLSEDVCSGASFTYTINSDFTSGVTYNWSRPTVIGIDGTGRNGVGNVITEDLVNNTAAPVQVNYTLTASYQGCTSTSTLILTVYPTPQLSSPLGVELCQGEALSYQPESNTNGAVFNWTIGPIPPGVTSTGSASGTGNINATFTHAFDFSVNVPITITSSANGCSGNSEQLLITLLPEPKLTNTATITLCSEEALNFIPQFNIDSSQVTFTWSRPSMPGISTPPSSGSGNIVEAELINTTTSSITITYNYSIESNGSCTNQGTIQVIVSPKPQLTVSSIRSVTICSGEEFDRILQTNTTSTVMTWSRSLPDNVSSNLYPSVYSSPSATNIQEILINNGNAVSTVNYQVLIAGENGCSSQTENIQVSVLPNPRIISSSSIAICSGDALNYSITTNILGSDAEFLWSRTDTNTLIQGGSTIESNGILINDILSNVGSQTQQAEYTIYINHRDCTSRQNSITLTIDVGAAIEFNVVTPEVICSGASPTDLLSYLSPNVTSYNWSRSSVNGVDNSLLNGTNANWDSQVLINSTQSDIDLTYQIDATDGICLESFVYQLRVKANPRIENNNISRICNGEVFEYELDVDPSITVLSWQRSDSSSVSGTSLTIYDDQLINNTNTSRQYTYEVIIENTDGCLSTEQLTVFVDPIPIITNSNPNIEVCSGDVFNFTPVSNVANAQISWTRINNNSISDNPTSGVGVIADRLTLVSSVASNVTVTYEITTQALGCSTTTTIDIVVLPPPLPGTVDYDGEEYLFTEAIPICSSESFQIEINPLVPTGSTSVVNSVPVFKVKSWSRLQQNGISNAPKTVYSLPAERSLTISESLVNTTGSSLFVTYQITLENTQTGCEKIYDYFVLIRPQTALNLVSPIESTYQTICAGQSIAPVIYSISGTVSTYSFDLEEYDGTNWVDVDLPNLNDSQQGSQIQVMGSIEDYGQYRFSIEIIDSCGNSYQETSTISVNEIPQINVTSSNENQNICLGSEISEITFEISTDITAISSDALYFNDLPSGLVFQKQQVDSFTISATISGTPLAAGTYNYGLLLGGACFADFSGTLLVDNSSEVQLTSSPTLENQIVCNGELITEVEYTVTHFDQVVVEWSSTDRNGTTTPFTSTPPNGITINENAGSLTISGRPDLSSVTNQSLIYNYRISALKEDCITFVYPEFGDLPSIQIVQPIQIDENQVDARLRSCVASERYIDLTNALSGGSIPISSTISTVYRFDWVSPNGVEFESSPRIDNLVEGQYTVTVVDLLSECSTDINFEVIAEDQLSLRPSNDTTYYTQINNNRVQINAGCFDDEVNLGVMLTNPNVVGNRLFEDGQLIGNFTVSWFRNGTLEIPNTNGIIVSRSSSDTQSEFNRVYEARVVLTYAGDLSTNTPCQDSYFFEVNIPEKYTAVERVQDRVEAVCGDDFTTLIFDVLDGKDGAGPYTISIGNQIEASSLGPNDRRVIFNIADQNLILDGELIIRDALGCEASIPNYSFSPSPNIPLSPEITVVNYENLNCLNGGTPGSVELSVDEFPATASYTLEVNWSSDSGFSFRQVWTSPTNLIWDNIPRADTYRYEVHLIDTNGGDCVVGTGEIVIEDNGSQQLVLRDIEVNNPGCNSNETTGSIVLDIDDSTIAPPLVIEWYKRDINSSSENPVWQELTNARGFGSLLNQEVGTYKAILKDRRYNPGSEQQGDCASGYYETRDITIIREDVRILNFEKEIVPVGNCSLNGGVAAMISFRVESNVDNGDFDRTFEISLTGEDNSAVIDNQAIGNIVFDSSDAGRIGQNFVINGLTNDRWLLVVNEVISGVDTLTTRYCSDSYTFNVDPFDQLEYDGATTFNIDPCDGIARVFANISGGVPFVENGQEYYIYNWRFTPTDENGEPLLNAAPRTFIGREIPGGIDTPGILELTVEDSVGCTISNIGEDRDFSVIRVRDTVEPFRLVPYLENSDQETVFAVEPTCVSDDTGQIGFDVVGGVEPYYINWFTQTVNSSTTNNPWVELPDIANSTYQSNLIPGIYKIIIQSRFSDCNIRNSRNFFEQIIQVPINDELTSMGSPYITDQELCAGNPGQIFVDIFDNQAGQLTFYYNGEIIQNPTRYSETQYGLDIIRPLDNSTLLIVNELGCTIRFNISLGLGIADFRFTSPSNFDLGANVQARSVMANEQVTFTNLSTNPYVTEEWIFGDLSDVITRQTNNGTLTPVSHTYALPGTYLATLNIYNEIGCMDTAVKPVIVGSGYNVMIPTVFSPNGDGINDRFFPLFSGFREVTFEVYDYRGNLIYTEFQQVSSEEFPEPFAIEGWPGPSTTDDTVGEGDNNPFYIYNFVGKTFIENKTVERSGAFILAR